MKYFYHVLLAVSLCLATPGAHADSGGYFKPETVAVQLLSPPLATKSDAWNHEVDLIIERQKAVSDADLAQANIERDLQAEMMFTGVDEKYTRSSYPALYNLLDRVSATSRPISDTAKNYFKTKRPYLADPRIKALIKAHDNPSYPSGHTTGSYLWAEVLSLALPQKRSELLARAKVIAEHRVLVGMHFPHDLAGGRELALLIMGGLLQNADFQRDLEAAKRELQATPKQ